MACVVTYTPVPHLQGCDSQGDGKLEVLDCFVDPGASVGRVRSGSAHESRAAWPAGVLFRWSTSSCGGDLSGDSSSHSNIDGLSGGNIGAIAWGGE